MKQFTISQFKTHEHLLQAKVAYYERLLNTHKKIFEWVERNPSCHPDNIRFELRKLLEELEE